MQKLLLILLPLLSFLSTQAQEQPVLVIDPQGHSARVRDVVFTADRKRLISVSEDKTLRIWNTSTGDLVATLRSSIGEGPIGKLNAAALSSDDRLLAIGGYSSNNEIRIIDLQTRKQVSALKGHQNVITDLAFSPNGQYLISGSGDKTAKIWPLANLSTNSSPTAQLTLEGHSAAVYNLAVAPDGRQVATASLDGTIRLWQISADWGSARLTKVMDDHQDRVLSVAFSPDGKYIASGGYDGRIILWDAEGKLDLVIEDLHGQIYHVSFSPDSQKIVGITNRGQVGLYELPLAFKTGEFTEHDNTVTAGAFAKQDKNDLRSVIATAGGEAYDIYVWNANTRQVITHMTGKGKSNWSVARGKGLQIAIGQTNESAKENRKGPLEKTFDFATLTFHPEKPNSPEFTRVETNFQGKALKRKKDEAYVLQIGSTAQIQNNPDTDRILRCYTYTPKGQIVVGSGASLKLYDQAGQMIREYIGHADEVWAVSVSEDGKYLYSASGDQTVKVWNLQTAENLATLFIAADNEWVCWTPQGYYAASAGGEKYIGWQINKGLQQLAEFYPVNTFRKQFFHPELVKRTLQTGSFENAFAQYQPTQPEQLVAEPEITNTLPPQIEWLFPTAIDNETSNKTIKIQARVTSDSKIKQVKLLVNGRTYSSRGIKPSSKSTDHYRLLEYEVELVHRSNRLQVFAKNIHAATTSDERVVHYLPPATAKYTEVEEGEFPDELPFDVADFEVDYIEKPNLYLLSIGVSQFKNSEYNLTYADADAKAVARMYQQQRGRLYNHIYTKELLNEQATQQNILKQFKWLEEQATPSDMVVIFIATHGINLEGEFFILPHDGESYDLKRSGVNWSHFAEVIGNLPSKVLLFVDACNSGQLGANVAKRDNTEALRTMASDEYGVVIMSASTGVESSFEHPDWGHGAFTLALLEGLEKGEADFKKDFIVYLRELDLFVADKVQELTQGKQHPTTQKPSTISQLPVVQLAE
ncbi:caspase family protein [Rapidithrix thailandica]|uniref:Caspase family protein n=2 Tax=Rapidithrix thailandica TaxID=413964 RepID=A0AAW9RW30_9BACT